MTRAWRVVGRPANRSRGQHPYVDSGPPLSGKVILSLWPASFRRAILEQARKKVHPQGAAGVAPGRAEVGGGTEAVSSCLVRRQDTQRGLGQQCSRSRKMRISDHDEKTQLRGSERNKGEKGTQTFPVAALSRVDLIFVLPKAGEISTGNSDIPLATH